MTLTYAGATTGKSHTRTLLSILCGGLLLSTTGYVFAAVPVAATPPAIDSFNLSVLSDAAEENEQTDSKNEVSAHKNQPYADVLYTNGDIITMDGEHAQYVEAIAVRDGNIQQVGTRLALEARQGPDTQVVDLLGSTLLPGLVQPLLMGGVLSLVFAALHLALALGLLRWRWQATAPA